MMNDEFKAAWILIYHSSFGIHGSVNRRVVGGRGLALVVGPAHLARLVDEEGAAARLAVGLRRGRRRELVAERVDLDLVAEPRDKVFLKHLLVEEFVERGVAPLLPALFELGLDELYSAEDVRGLGLAAD